jgi:hypothetical protein
MRHRPKIRFLESLLQDLPYLDFLGRHVLGAAANAHTKNFVENTCGIDLDRTSYLPASSWIAGLAFFELT